MVLKIENLFFKYRMSILSGFVVLTIVMGFFASQLRLDAGFYKQRYQAITVLLKHFINMKMRCLDQTI